MDGLPPRAPPSVARYGPVPAATPYHRGGLEVGSSGGGNSGVSPPPPQGVALAYHEVHKQQAQRKSTAWKVWLVLGDCTLIGLSPVLVHMAKDSQGHYAFSPISVNLLVELAKTLFALGTLIAYGTGRPGLPMYRSWRSFLRDARHNHLLLIPAGLYAVNNYLKFLMQLYFRPTTAKMLSNLKILVIAVLMKGVLGRTFSLFQWEALYLLVAGITVNQLNYCGQEGGGDIFSTASLLYTLGSITVPSLASVYNEFALKKHMDTSVLLQNFFLYFFGMCFNLIGLLLMMATGHMAPSHVLTGFRAVTVVLVVNNALQGILSSFFYKYADTILKKYSSTIATIFTGLASAALFGHPLTLNFLIGVSIVFISMHLFFSMGSLKEAAVPPGKDHGGATSTKLAVSPSMDHLLSLSTAASRTQSTLSMASLAGGSGSGSGAAAGAEADGLATLLGPKAAARAPAVLPR